MPTKYLLELCKIPFQEKSLRAEKQGLYKEYNRPTHTFAHFCATISNAIWLMGNV
jgi:hypothetical protein